jgi:hypothetical protein
MHAVLGGRNEVLHCRELFFGCPCGEDIIAMLSQALKDSGDVFGTLALSEDNFGHAVSQCPMVIDLGETKIFEGHVPHTFDGFVGRDLAFFDVVEQRADRFCIQADRQPKKLSNCSLLEVLPQKVQGALACIGHDLRREAMSRARVDLQLVRDVLLFG